MDGITAFISELESTFFSEDDRLWQTLQVKEITVSISGASHFEFSVLAIGLVNSIE
jgi:hypothetical protein